MTAALPSVDDRIARAAAVRPSSRQLTWQRHEFYAFIHFGMNTMTDREWGLGHEDPALFDPTDVDVDQWVRACVGAGMRAVILTCKHHDGFALWPSAVSRHTVAASPWRSGAGDLVAEVARACAAAGLGFGVYLSPWDRTESTYGSGTAYDDFFVAQLTELLTGYGPLFSVWFDGANGEGPDGRTQYYDWDRYYALVRRLQPSAAISVCGPDVRWCGNEAGHTRPDEWSVVPASLRDAERTADLSQKVDDGAFATRVPSDREDLGSRSALLASAEELVWYPAEVNTSIRPGWFHHPTEDDQVRSAAELFDIYCASVGGNATFLLNLPPDRRGRLSPPDVEVLTELGERVRELDTRDIAVHGRWEFSSRPVAPDSLVRSEGADPPWRPDPGDRSPRITVRWAGPREVSGVVVREDITYGQQVESMEVHGMDEDGGCTLLGRVGSVGYQRILQFPVRRLVGVSVVFPTCRGQLALHRLRVLEPSARAGDGGSPVPATGPGQGGCVPSATMTNRGGTR